jgi:hypothetical protein
MKACAIMEERIRNFVDAVSFKEPDKVPVSIETLMWPFSYEGKTFRQVMDEPELAAKTYTKFLDDIEIDIFTMFPGVAFPVKVYEALGSKKFFLSGDDTGIQHYQTADVYMNDDEYPELIHHYETFIDVTMIRRRFPVFTQPREVAYSALKKAAVEMKKHREINMRISADFERRGVPLVTGPLSGAVSFFSPLNTLFDSLRGMKNTIVDLRRRPDEVKEAMKVIAGRHPAPRVNAGAYGDRHYPFALVGYHSECFLTPKQFDELFFAGFMKYFEPLVNAGMKIYLKGEGSFLNTVDRYRQLPKGTMYIYLDEDDPFEMHKAIGDWAAIGTGITTNLLKFGTTQQCLDYAKKCFDTFAPGGGFVFIPSKPLSSANEANPDNLRAVYAFANEYGKR